MFGVLICVMSSWRLTAGSTVRCRFILSLMHLGSQYETLFGGRRPLGVKIKEYPICPQQGLNFLGHRLTSSIFGIGDSNVFAFVNTLVCLLSTDFFQQICMESYECEQRN